MGSFSNLSAVELGVAAVKKLMDRVEAKSPKISRKQVERVYFGNVLQSGLGQNVARQVALNAGLNEAVAVTINVVCGSGMESIHQGYNAILLGEADIVLVGGTESMSNAPYLNQQLRKGNKYGHVSMLDSVLCDGLTDAFSGKHMGELTEEVNLKYGITREMQDNYAKMSYTRARNASATGKLQNEIVDVEVKDGKNIRIVNTDEETNKVPDLNKLTQLKPVFNNMSGTITAGNASKLNDGACAMLLVSQKFIDQMSVQPIAHILGFDMTVGTPNEFSRVPITSVKKLANRMLFNLDQIDLFEVNEAFSSIPIMFHQECGIDLDKVNIYGGAVSLGHPIGCSGARIVGTLLTSLRNEGKRYGCASICNGGGGAISIMIEMID